MINLIIGIFAGVAGTILYFKGTTLAWYIWALFLLGTVSFIFGMDVLSGSIKEHERRAAVMGFLMFGIPGVVLIGLSFVLGF